ncbi:helix-turn-helix domain-containing protein [Microbacterium sp. zg.Y1090]|uniref:helix-turn-helix domain-containing protein n=1 Tax=Microbacterium wangruii TaxID=3049073 RepID=UPI00214B74DF|nr:MULTISPECIES: helix-turn-helix transcriptional regulator [unclassified Microbacterium]MCR2817435.1 helix-turn-helix domain-containing protein [Microbacterium sp. zg.Y1090]WIM29079.1 helix-turn-helix transcriptional regulator [Microbacterium sp. zg-Y1090]
MVSLVVLVFAMLGAAWRADGYTGVEFAPVILMAVLRALEAECVSVGVFMWITMGRVPLDHKPLKQNREGTLLCMETTRWSAEDAAYAKALGAVLAGHKDASGLSFSDLAQMTGLSRAHLTRVVYGTIDARIQDLERLCKVLEVDLVHVISDPRLRLKRT